MKGDSAYFAEIFLHTNLSRLLPLIYKLGKWRGPKSLIEKMLNVVQHMSDWAGTGSVLLTPEPMF